MTDTNDLLKNKAVAVKKSTTSGKSHIIAKGKGYLAEQILDIAFKKGVKVRQDKDLADLLEQFDVDSPIPLEALSAVSEILDYVYKANQSMLPKNTDESAEYTDSHPVAGVKESDD